MFVRASSALRMLSSSIRAEPLSIMGMASSLKKPLQTIDNADDVQVSFDLLYAVVNVRSASPR